MELSRDKIKEIINDDWLLMDDCEGNKNCDVVKELARIALASLEAEPIGYMNRFTGRVFTLEEQPGADTDAQVYVPFYTAPPAPVLPRDLEEIIFSIVNAMADEKLRDDESELFSLAKKYIEHAKSKLGAAMLQGAEPVSNRDELTDGWVACSERMPGEVLAALQNVARLRRNLNDFCGDKSLIAKCLSEAEGALLNAVNRHSTMLAEPLKEAKNV